MNKISIIIPIHNVEQYLSKCLESICRQTYKNLEIICVDDCSSDESVKLIKDFSKKDERVILIQNEKNSGASIARNNGLEVATGEYVYFIDSDDWIDDDYLSKMVDAIQKSGTDIVLNLNIVNEFTDRAMQYVHPTFTRVREEGEIVDKKRALLDAPWHIWARLYKKSFLDKYNLKFINITALNDFVFHYITHIHIDSLFVFYGSTYHYISRKDSITGETKKYNNRDLYAMQAYNFIYDYFKTNNLLNKYEIKMFSVWPFFVVDTEEKYGFYKSFFQKISDEHLKINQKLYNELELFFSNNILKTKDFADYKSNFGTNVAISFMRRKSK